MSFSRAIDSLLKSVNKVFGSTANYISLVDGTETEISGVFDNAFVEIQGVATRRPIFRIRDADLEATPEEGDRLEISDTTYLVKEVQPDGNGASVLILEKA